MVTDGAGLDIMWLALLITMDIRIPIAMEATSTHIMVLAALVVMLMDLRGIQVMHIQASAIVPMVLADMA